MDNLYIHFYHGRNKIDEKLDDWGFDAPFLVGPLNIQWTYGYIKFWGGDEMHHLITQEDLVPIKGKYYGDFGALHEGEDVVCGAIEGTNEYKIISLEEFIKLNKI